MKLITLLFFFTLSFSLFADSFESYSFDTSIGKTDVLIGLQNDKIIFEKYSNHFNFNTPHVLHSLNKLFLNALIGNLEKNNLLSVYQPIQNTINDAYTSKITIDALMRMSSGLRTFTDPDTMEAINPGIIRPLDIIPDKLYDFYLLKSLPLHPPHTSYNYCFYDNNLLIQHLEDRFGREKLHNMMLNFFDQYNFKETKIFINSSNKFLFDDYNSFLNKILMKYNLKDMFYLPISLQSGTSSAKDILSLAKLYLPMKNEIFTSKWKSDSFSSNPQDFIKSRTLSSFFAPYSYGRFWFLNTPHADGTKVYPLLPSDVAVIHGLKGQMLAIFPTQKAIYLRLAHDNRDSKFDREKSLNQFYSEFLKK